jgi:hypothetical protein
MHPIITKIGYHNRDNFLGQWDKFRNPPWGDSAHSTHMRGRTRRDLRLECLAVSFHPHASANEPRCARAPRAHTARVINTWQSTDRGRCIVVMARSSRSQPDLTALSQGPGHHMRTIRHLTHRVIAEVPHDAQGVRDALTERLNPEQNPSARPGSPVNEGTPRI